MHDLTANERGPVPSPDAGVASSCYTRTNGHLCLEPSWERGCPGLVPFVSDRPRVRRAAVQMEAMGMWRPSLDPLRLH